MDGARSSHDQVVKELSGTASVRPSQIKKAAPPVAPKPKVVSQKGPEIQMTSSFEDFPMPPPQHMMFSAAATADDLPPPPPPIVDAEFSITANRQPLSSGIMNGSNSSGAGAGWVSGVGGGSGGAGAAAGAPSFVVRPVAPAGTTVSITPGATRLGPKPFVPFGGKAPVSNSSSSNAGSWPSSSVDDGPAYHGKAPAAPVVDEPPPPPPLHSASTTAPTRSVGSTLPFVSGMGAPAASSGGVQPLASASSPAPAGQSKPYSSSTTIVLGSGSSSVQPFSPSPSSSTAAPSNSAAAGQSQAKPFASASQLPSAAGGRATIDLSFTAGRGSSADASGGRGAGTQGGYSSPKPALSSAPIASAGSVTIKPSVPPPSHVPEVLPSPPTTAVKPKTSHESELDSLTNRLVQDLELTSDPSCLGVCAHCNKKIAADSGMCTAMDKPYHIECFACCSCKKQLTGQSFYLVRNEPQCEACYAASLEKCTACQQPITDRILRATGKAYHARCFTCVVCNRTLDGVPFTVDADNKVHCVEDFHKKYAPRCSVCNDPIMPEEGQEETVRIVALDRNFHIKCYKCEDCGLLLSSEAEGRGCYPFENHVLCRSCYSKRAFEKTTGGITQQPQTVPASDF